MRRRATHLLTSLCAAVVAVQASAGIRADRTYALPNAGFDAGLSGWSQTSSAGGAPFVPSDGPAGGVPSALVDSAAPAQARLWQTLPVGPQTSGGWLGRPDEKLELGAAVWIGASASAGRLRLEVHAATPGGSVVIAGSAPLDVAAAPRDRWLWLHTAPAGALQARVPADATQVTVLVIVDASGPVWIDRLLCGRFERGEWRLAGAGFEGGALSPAWVTSGQVTTSTPGVEADAYYGAGYLELGGAGPAWARQVVPLVGVPGTPAPRREAEACAWLHVEADAQLPSQPSASHVVELELLAWEQGSPWSTAQRVAHAAWMPTADDRGSWSFLETAPVAALPLDRSHVAVRVSKSFPGTLRVDHVQLGERYGVDGNPRRHVTAHYVGRYRSPLSPHAVTSPATSQGIWRNWAWTQPPACDPTYTRWYHQPDCAASPGCFRLNGRRDGAVGLEDGPDDLPLAGAYDSRDADVVRYHVRLAEAIGLDSFTYLHQGHTLALQTAAGGGEPLNEQAFETLLEVAEEPGRDLKVAVMYEPKVHLLGWVQGQPTLADKKAGIEADLVHLLDTYGDRKALLKRDGRVVVYLFRNDVCDPTGQQCLDDGDWLEMRTHVEQATGRGLFLVADVPPADLAFDGLSRWQLIALPLLRYRTWSQAASRTPAVPAPGVADAIAHAAAINAVAAGWSAQDDAARLAIGIAWPGFDDTGVGGWGEDNLVGTDGAPLCVRVAPDLGGAFLDATFEAAVESGAEWVQLASWNDWNERTHLEPRWSAGFAQAAWSGAAIPPAARQEALGRALRLQAAVAAFQARHGGGGGTPADLERAAVEYLRLARYRASVVEYD